MHQSKSTRCATSKESLDDLFLLRCTRDDVPVHRPLDLKCLHNNNRSLQTKVMKPFQNSKAEIISTLFKSMGPCPYDSGPYLPLLSITDSGCLAKHGTMGAHQTLSAKLQSYRGLCYVKNPPSLQYIFNVLIQCSSTLT